MIGFQPVPRSTFSGRAVGFLALSVALLLVPACTRTDAPGGVGASGLGSLEGTVLSVGAPLQGVRVIVDNNPAWTSSTSSQGYFMLRGVPAGIHRVAVDGAVVFDGAGVRLPSRADIHFDGISVVAGAVRQIVARPIFTPVLDVGTQLAATATGSGTATYTFTSDMRIGNNALGCALDFTSGTVVTFPDPTKTTISISAVPIEQIPMPLPMGTTAVRVVSVQPGGAIFNPPPRVTFPNSNGRAAGSTGVDLYRFDHAVGDWTRFGTGTVTADGTSVVSDLPNSLNGLPVAGWNGATTPPFRTASCVCGCVRDAANNGIPGIQVVTVNAQTAITDANGNYSIDNVTIPAAGFSVVVTASPISSNTSGFLAASSAPMLDPGSGAITIPPIVLPSTGLPPDTTAPFVTAINPPAGMTGVHTNDNIQVTFSEPLSSGTITDASFTLTGPSAGVAGLVGLNGAVATFVPAVALAPNATYTATLTTFVSDLAGNHLATAFTSSFTTAGTAAPSLASVVITPVAPSPIIQGGTQQFMAEVRDSSMVPIPGATVVWSSSNPALVGISSTGLATGYAVGGPVVITADAGGGVTRTVGLTVTAPPVFSVVVMPSQLTVPTGSFVQYTAQARDVANAVIPGVPVTWSSSDGTNAPISATSGLLAAAGAAQSATITAMAGGVSGSTTVTIVDPASSIASIFVNPSFTMGVIGDTRQFMASALDSGDNVISGVSFAWSSTNTSVAVVDGLGVANAVGNGRADITASAGGQTGTGHFTVQSIASIAISPSPATVQPGLTQQFTAVAKDSGNVTIPNVAFAWTTGDPGVATVSGAGLATGVAIGTCSITATAGGATASATLNVSIAPPANLVVTLRGNAKAVDPRSGVRVLRHDPATGAFIAEMLTDAAGVADFGNIGAARTTLTIVDDDSPSNRSLTSLLNIPTGSMTIGVFSDRKLPSLATFTATLTNTPPNSVSASGSVGNYDMNNNGGGFVGGVNSANNTAVINNLDVTETQVDGLIGFLGTVVDMNNNLTGWGFQGGLDPATVNNSNINVATTGAVVTIPFTLNAPVTANSFVRVNGLSYEFGRNNGSGPSAAAAAGTLQTGTVPGASRYRFRFKSDETPTAARFDLVRTFSPLPSTVTDTLPALGITNIQHNIGTQTISWAQSGADLPHLQINSTGITFGIGNKSYGWIMLLDPTLTSATFPQVPPNLGSSIPLATTALALDVELHGGFMGVANYDDVYTKLTSAGGNFADLEYLEPRSFNASRGQGLIALQFFNTGPGTNQMVTMTPAPTIGPAVITAPGTYFLQFPGGTDVTFVGSQTGGNGIFWAGNGPVVSNTFMTRVQGGDVQGEIVLFN